MAIDYSNMVQHVSIDDIKNRLETNPEPEIVKEIREKILESSKMLRFEEEAHKYFIPNGKGGEKEIISVSGFVDTFVPEVDWDSIRMNKALKLGVEDDFLKEQWLYNQISATNAGTVTHNYCENLGNLMIHGDESVLTDQFKPQFEKGYLLPASIKQEAGRDVLEYLFSLPNIYIVLTETRVITSAYAGTFDLLVYQHDKNDPDNPERNGLKLLDYKTNVSLYNEFNQSKDNFMLAPFNTLIDEAYGHYVVQQSAYQVGLERIGLRVLNRSLIHLRDANGVAEYEFVNLPDVTDNIKTILEERK